MAEDPGDQVRDPAASTGQAPAEYVDVGQRSYLVAPVQPLDVTGTRTVTIGVIAWAIAFLALLPFYGRLRDDGNLWWLWTCVAGFGLGLLGRAYCRRREQQLHRTR